MDVTELLQKIRIFCLLYKDRKINTFKFYANWGCAELFGVGLRKSIQNKVGGNCGKNGL